MAFPKTLDLNDPIAVRNFIGGRRKINSNRQFARLLRLERLVEIWSLEPTLSQAELSRRLNCSRTTISRDVRVIKELMQQQKSCPVCGELYRPDLRAGFQDQADNNFNSS